jgi:gamma-glutamyltranspeptidase
VSEKRAVAAWSPDGEWLTLAELPAQAPGYNGDPARLGDRRAGDVFSREGHLWVVRAHLLPDTDISEVSLAVPATRIVHNAEAFDRVWLRMERLYYGGRGREPWERLRSEYRDRALSAMTEEALESTIHEMLIERPPSRVEVSGSAAVSSAHHLATEAGVEVLRQGGNPVDAAVAVSFAIGVVEPDASGVGGYGEMVLYLRHMDQPVVIEFLSRVPEQAGLANALLLEDGDLPSDGPVLANVPGTVAGMWLAWKEYGSGNLKWSQLLAPAIRLAENGFVLDDAFPTTLAIESESFLKYESSRKLFFPNGDPLQPGDTLRNPDLAWTLRQIAEGGADAFYRGAVAHRMVADLRGQGNAMTLRDMERYFAAKREPVRGEYRGHTVFSAAPAAGGGVSLVAKLNSLDRFENPALYSEDVATAHAMIEAWKLVPSSSGRVADPGLWPVDTGPLLDREAAGRRWERCFDPGKSLSPDDLERRAAGEPACAEEATELSWGEQMSDCSVGLPCRRSGTTAFAVADSAGNMVAVTQTLGTWGGNFYVSPGLGFLYNDKLRSYSTDPDSYGARLPYARHGTSIAPTLAFRGTGHRLQPRFAVGAAGNAWITSAVYQMTAAMIDRDIGPQNALELPRFLIGSRRESGQTREVVVQIEDVFAPHVVRGLQKLGHRLQRISLRGELRMGYGAVVSIDGKCVRAGGDPRRSGAAGAIP